MPDFPKLPTWMGAGDRLINEFGAAHRGEKTWYDNAGNIITPDPTKYKEVYDALGQRHVFWRGGWEEDDPRISPLAMALPGLFTGNPAGFWTGTAYGFGVLAQEPPQTPIHLDYAGNYIDAQGKPIRPDSFQWMVEKWGDNIPPDELKKWEAKHGLDTIDVDPYEATVLDDYRYRAATYDNQGLVKMGKPPLKAGDEFIMNGQRAIMGNIGQYAVTQNGAGDRWKYKIAKDSEGNWVRTYYRTFGAKKEKAAKLKKKRENS